MAQYSVAPPQPTDKLVEEGESDVAELVAPPSRGCTARAAKIAGISVILAAICGVVGFASQPRGESALVEPEFIPVGKWNEGHPGCTNGQCTDSTAGMAACCSNSCGPAGQYFCFANVDSCFLDSNCNFVRKLQPGGSGSGGGGR